MSTSTANMQSALSVTQNGANVASGAGQKMGSLTDDDIAHELKNLFTAFKGSLIYVLKEVEKISTQNVTAGALQKKLEKIKSLNQKLLKLVLELLEKEKSSTAVISQQQTQIPYLANECLKFCDLVNDVCQELNQFSSCLNDVKELMEGMKTAARDLRTFISPWLSPVSQSKTLIMKEFDPVAACKDVMSIYKAKALEKKLDVILSPPPVGIGKLISAVGTLEGSFKSILGNFLLNAIKHTETGGSIVLALEVVEQTIAELTLKGSVQDTGKGIPGDKLPRIGDLHYRVDDSKKDGFGIGLNMSKKLIDTDLKGNFEVKSELGKGSTFAFSFTAKRSVVDINSEMPVKKRSSSPTHITFPQLKSRKILIADDHEVNRKIVEKMLIEEGAVCKVVADGQDAVNACNEFKPDVILMDLHMPVMDGKEATRRIREMKSDIAKTPIIGLSATKNPDKDQTAQMDACLEKPSLKKVICTTIIAHLPPTAAPSSPSQGSEKTADSPLIAALALLDDGNLAAAKLPAASKVWCGFHAVLKDQQSPSSPPQPKSPQLVS